ncbi:MAG: AAA family ATPase [Planctomycetes bacterium]|nr:AAA family ATPase [Planctomycetota bacterium]
MTEEADPAGRLELGRRLSSEVLDSMKRAFVGKDEIIDLMGVCLVAAENLFILGPPGTAKSALVHELGQRLEGRTFSYLLTRFTEPSELFGPFDIRKLRDGELLTNTDGMLPEAALVFLDELLNANSAILNSLLTALNERVFRRGKETRPLPMLMAVGASNHLPEDEALGALFDRFLVRVRCDNVPPERLGEVLDAGWKLDLGLAASGGRIHVDDVRSLHELLPRLDLSGVRPAYTELVHRLRHAGVSLSDRRAVKVQRLVAASALLCGRTHAEVSDLWVVRHIWDTIEQQEVMATIVQDAMARLPSPGRAHPRSRGLDAPDPESLARDLDHLLDHARSPQGTATEKAYLKDRLGLLAGRCQWVQDAERRTALGEKVDALWELFGGKP